MADLSNPALAALVALLEPEFILLQVRILRQPQGFELRHVADQAKALSELRPWPIQQLRTLAQTTAAGAFRPLRSAPTLRQGWFSVAVDPSELGLALDHLYPGAVADWFAARKDPAAAISFRQFTARQTGMYRLTQKLSDAQAARVARAVCPPQFCLKQRRWTIECLPPDSVAEKSRVPCLEPCALFLEFARKAARWEGEEKVPVSLSASELASLKQVLRNAQDPPFAAGAREADFDNAANPRRLQWILEKLESGETQ